MPDLPSGDWSQLLVGHQWPGSATLSTLGAAATDRAAVGSAYDGYADLLRSIHTGSLAAQEGLAAESARQSFRLGETRARDIAARNRAKQMSYASAQQWVHDLRSDLASIAAAGDAAIRRILDSSDPTPQKISAITQTITEARQHANIRAAACCANVCDAIQTVLTAAGTVTSARALARSHGVDLDRAFLSPNPEFVHAEVSAMVTAPSGGPGGVGTAAQPDALSPDSLGESFAAGASAGAITAGAANALRNAPYSAAAATVDTTAPTQISPLPREPAPGIVSLTPLSHIPASTALGAPPGPARSLPRYGADIRAPAQPGRASPVVGTAAAPVSAPAGAATMAALAHSSTVRHQASAAPTPLGNATGALRPVAACEDAAGSISETRLRRILNSVARQEPTLGWAVGDRQDTSTVLVTDLASGWIPPHIDIPAEVTLLEPRRRAGGLMALLDGAVLTATYLPGSDPGRDHAFADQNEPIPVSSHARLTAAVDDLGWELSQATRGRDGLPRLAHTLARAGAAGTGCLDSEIALLREQLRAVARGVLDNYPATDGGTAVGNWQLMACVEALIDGDRTLANYHFSWFHAHARQSGLDLPR
jgi:hypothetical protein